MPLLVPVNDATAAEVVRAELDDHPVVWQNPDLVHPHLPADVGEYFVPVVQLHAEEGIRQRFHHRALDLDGAVFFGHILRASSCVVLAGVLAVRSSSDRQVELDDGTPPWHEAMRKASRCAAAESTAPLTRTRTGRITPALCRATPPYGLFRVKFPGRTAWRSTCIALPGYATRARENAKPRGGRAGGGRWRGPRG